jgi:hypothetical protein
MRVVLPILANIILGVAALGFGSLFLRLIPRRFSELDRFTLRFLAGFGLLGTILFCVGQVWFSRLAILFVLLPGLLLGLFSWLRARFDCWLPLKDLHAPLLPAAIVFGVALVTAVGGVALPTGDTNNDAIAYHYLGPKVWLREGIIRPVPDEIRTYFPVVVETQYAALMSIGGARAPQLFSVVSLAILLLIAASLAMRLGLDSSGAWWVAALIATMPAVYRGTYGGFLDALFACFILAAARVGFDAETPADYALFGLFCGFAMGAKYNGILAFLELVFCASLISVWAHRRPAWLTVKSAAIACGAAIAIASPFYLRNWILYECPIYPPAPALLHIFHLTHPIPNVIQAIVNDFQKRGGGMGRGVVAFLFLAFNLTYHTALFRGAGGIGLVPLALAPFGILARKRDAFAMGLLLLAALESVSWFLTAQESRYAINMFVIAGLFGVVGWQYVAGLVSRNARILAAVAVGISIFYGLWMIFPERVEDVHAALSPSFETKRWHAETICADGYDFINREASVKNVLVLSSSVASFFIDKPYVKPFGVWGERSVPGSDTVPEVMARLPALHVTHVFDYRPEGESFQLPEHPPGLTLVFERADQRIYRID